jgi:hypothetical protein
MDEASKLHRRWLTFSLRGLFVAVTLLCVWLAVHVKWIRDRHEALKWVETINARSSRVPPGGLTGWSHVISYDPVPAPWQIRILGESGVSAIHVDRRKVRESDNADSKLLKLQQLFPEAAVTVN